MKKSIYMYPMTSESFPVVGNQYIPNLVNSLKTEFTIVNKGLTKLGTVDILRNLNRSDFIYFNWIEDLPDKRMGYFQIVLLLLIVLLSKIKGTKLIWFVHDNLSHTKKNIRAKKFIASLMARYSDYIIAHTANTRYNTLPNFYSFDHPMDAFTKLPERPPYKYDILIWGKMLPYKGIAEFLEHRAADGNLKAGTVLIAGEFTSDAYLQRVISAADNNVIIFNRPIPEDELITLFTESKYVLFTYNSPSVLSSAALCKTLSCGKEIIGPDLGSFKEFGEKKLIYTYSSWRELGVLFGRLSKGTQKIEQQLVAHYIEDTTWPRFVDFLKRVLVPAI